MRHFILYHGVKGYSAKVVSMHKKMAIHWDLTDIPAKWRADFEKTCFESTRTRPVYIALFSFLHTAQSDIRHDW